MRTVKSVMYAATLVAIPIALALAFDVPGVNDLAPLEGFGDMAIDTAWLPFAVLLSAAAAWGVATNYGMRCGGFVGAAFIAMFMGDPWQVIVAGAIAATTYLIVTRLLMNHMILFGRRKFSAMLLVASSLSWVLLWSGREFFGPEVQHHLDLGSLALTPLFLPGLIANDAQRTSPRKVVLGLAMASTFVLSWTWWAQSLFEGLALALAWKVVAVAAFGAIFWRQVVPVRGRNTAADTTDDVVVHAVPIVVPARVVPARVRSGAAVAAAVADLGRRGVRDGWLPTLGHRPPGGRSGRRTLAHDDRRRRYRRGSSARASRRRSDRHWLVTAARTPSSTDRAVPDVRLGRPVRSGPVPRPADISKVADITRVADISRVRAGSTPCGPRPPRMIRAPRGARDRVARRRT